MSEKSVFRSGKREDVIGWDDYFMGVAFLAAQRSKDPKCQVGACIVSPDLKIVGVGYNGFPRGCSDDKYPWKKDKWSPLNSKLTYVCHAELNAVLNTVGSSTKGCKMYVALFPCNECAKVIIQAGISEVIYRSDKNCGKARNIASLRMLRDAGVKLTQFFTKRTRIVIDFDALPVNNVPSEVDEEGEEKEVKEEEGEEEKGEEEESPSKKKRLGSDGLEL